MEVHAEHKPVLYAQTMQALQLEPGLVICDGTLGGGGHTAGILQAIRPGGL